MGGGRQSLVFSRRTRSSAAPLAPVGDILLGERLAVNSFQQEGLRDVVELSPMDWFRRHKHVRPWIVGGRQLQSFDDIPG